MVDSWRILAETLHVQSGLQLGPWTDRRLRRNHDIQQCERRTTLSTGRPPIDGFLEAHWHWRCMIKQLKPKANVWHCSRNFRHLSGPSHASDSEASSDLLHLAGQRGTKETFEESHEENWISKRSWNRRRNLVSTCVWTRDRGCSRLKRKKAHLHFDRYDHLWLRPKDPLLSFWMSWISSRQKSLQQHGHPSKPRELFQLERIQPWRQRLLEQSVHSVVPQETKWRRNPRWSWQVQQAVVEGSHAIGTHNRNLEGRFPLVAFHQNEDHEEQEMASPHPLIVGCHCHSAQHAVDIQREHGNHRLDWWGQGWHFRLRCGGARGRSKWTCEGRPWMDAKWCSKKPAFATFPGLCLAHLD